MKSPGVEHCEQLPGVVQVIACDLAEAEGVEIADGDGGEQHGRSHDLVHFGDVRKLQVELNPVHADIQQEAQGAEEEEQPQAASRRHSLGGEDVSDAMQCGREGEHLERRRMLAVLLRGRLHLHIRCLDGFHSERFLLLSRAKKKKPQDFNVSTACT